MENNPNTSKSIQCDLEKGIHYIPCSCPSTFTWLNNDHGWICPKCTRVYSPSSLECYVCNAAIKVLGPPRNKI